MRETEENWITHQNGQNPHPQYHLQLKTEEEVEVSSLRFEKEGRHWNGDGKANDWQTSICWARQKPWNTQWALISRCCLEFLPPYLAHILCRYCYGQAQVLLPSVTRVEQDCLVLKQRKFYFWTKNGDGWVHALESIHALLDRWWVWSKTSPSSTQGKAIGDSFSVVPYPKTRIAGQSREEAKPCSERKKSHMSHSQSQGNPPV